MIDNITCVIFELQEEKEKLLKEPKWRFDARSSTQNEFNETRNERVQFVLERGSICNSGSLVGFESYSVILDTHRVFTCNPVKGPIWFALGESHQISFQLSIIIPNQEENSQSALSPLPPPKAGDTPIAAVGV